MLPCFDRFVSLAQGLWKRDSRCLGSVFAAPSKCLLFIKSYVAIFAKLRIGAAVLFAIGTVRIFQLCVFFVFDFGGLRPRGANFNRRLVLMVAVPN